MPASPTLCHGDLILGQYTGTGNGTYSFGERRHSGIFDRGHSCNRRRCRHRRLLLPDWRHHQLLVSAAGNLDIILGNRIHRQRHLHPGRRHRYSERRESGLSGKRHRHLHSDRRQQYLSGFLTLGSAVGGDGTYNLSGATSSLDTHGETIGACGTGLFQQSGGTNTLHNDLIVGLFAGSTNSTYALSGGTLEFPTAGSRLIVGEAGSGVFFSQTGGTINAVSAPGNLDIILGNKATGNGIYTLDGATTILNAGNLTSGSGHRHLHPDRRQQYP